MRRRLRMAGIAGLALLAAGAAQAADPLEIVALGDSLTQGYGLPPDQGFVPRLQAWLDAHGAGARVINAGVSGDTTAGGLARLDWSLGPGTDALIVALGGNDLLRGLPPEAARANLDRILTRAGERGLPVLLIGLTAPGNYGAAYKAGYDDMWQELATAHGALLLRDFLAPLIAMDPAARAAMLQPDRLHPAAPGVERIVAHVGPAVLDLIARARAK